MLFHKHIGPWEIVLQVILQVQFSNLLYKMEAEVLAVKFLSGECNATSIIKSQHWFRWWLGDIRQQAIARTRFMSSHSDTILQWVQNSLHDMERLGTDRRSTWYLQVRKRQISSRPSATTNFTQSWLMSQESYHIVHMYRPIYVCVCVRVANIHIHSVTLSNLCTSNPQRLTWIYFHRPV